VASCRPTRSAKWSNRRSSLTSYNGLSVITPEPTASGGKAINDNFKALSTALKTTNPASSNDNTQGYSVGSRWFNSTTGVEWLCTSSTTGAAVWVSMAQTLEQVTTAGATTDKAVTLSNGLSMSGTNINMSGGQLVFDPSANLMSDGSGNLEADCVRLSLYGSPLYMNDGSGLDGGDFYLDGGTLHFDNSSYISLSGATIFFAASGSLDFTGSAGLAMFNEHIPIVMQSGSISMNDGSGTGGGPINLDGGQIVKMRAENLASAPSSPYAGQIYFNTANSHFYGWNGTAWKQLDN
jgi:hypothetical protein